MNNLSVNYIYNINPQVIQDPSPVKQWKKCQKKIEQKLYKKQEEEEDKYLQKIALKKNKNLSNKENYENNNLISINKQNKNINNKKQNILINSVEVKKKSNIDNLTSESCIKTFNKVIDTFDKNWNTYASKANPYEMNFIGATVATKWILKIIDEVDTKK